MSSHRFNPAKTLPSATQSSSVPVPISAHKYPDSVLLKLARRTKCSAAPVYGSSWDTRIPLSYGDRFGHLKWMKEYDEFCNIVEKNRIVAADRKYDTLAAISARSVSKNLSLISADALTCLPDHVLDLVTDEIMADPRVLMTLKDSVWDGFPARTLQRIWDGLYENQQLNLHLWKALSSRLRAETIDSAKELRLYRFEQHIQLPEKSESFCAITKPLISKAFDFITSLSIGHLLPMMEYIRLSSIINLGTLEISEDPVRRVDPDSPNSVIDFDRVFRAWAAKAELGSAFQVLRSVRINISDSSLTTDILPHLNKFPALAIVYPGQILRHATKNGRKNKGRYISDHDFRTLQPLLPQGWKGVTIMKSRDARTRDIVDSLEYSPYLNKDEKPSEVEFRSNHSDKCDFQTEMGKDAYNSLSSRFMGRLEERHCIHELLDFVLQQRLSDTSRQQELSSGRCATPDAQVLCPANYLQKFPEEILTHSQLAKAMAEFQRARKAVAPQKATKDYLGLFQKPMPAFGVAGNEKGRGFEDGEKPVTHALDGDSGDTGLRDNFAFRRCSRSEGCLRISEPTRRDHTDGARTGRYISPSTSFVVSEEHSAPAITTNIYARNSFKQQQQIQKAQKNGASAEVPDTYGKTRLQGISQLPLGLSVELPIIGEPVSPTTEGQMSKLKTSEYSSPSIESELYHEKPCKRHPTERFLMPPAPNKKHHNCNHGDASGSDSSFISKVSNVSCESHISDLFEEEVDIGTYTRGVLPCIIHDNAGRASAKPCNQKDSDRNSSYARGCASGLKAAELRLHGQDMIRTVESGQPRNVQKGQQKFCPQPPDNMLGVSHSAAVHDRHYSLGTEEVRLLEFGMLGMLRLDADLKAVGMNAGPAMLCAKENGETILSVESQAPVISLRIGKQQKWKSEGQMVLVREDLPTEEEIQRAKRRKEHEKEEVKAWIKPPRRNKKEPEVRLDSKEAEKKRTRNEFDESFWQLTGMEPSKRKKID